MISKDIFKKSFEGYQIQDVAVRSKTIFYFYTRNKREAKRASAVTEGDVTKRFIAFSYIDGEAKSSNWEVVGPSYARLTLAASTTPEIKGVCVTIGGKALISGGGKYETEEIPLHENGPRRGILVRARMILGVFYAVGAFHSVCRRRGANDWESLCLNLPLPTEAEYNDVKTRSNMRFDDIDGFSHDDLYVIGGLGNVWNFDGKAWRRIQFPSNMNLESVCCAGDGHVYIGAQSGTLFRGRGDKWEMIHRGDMSLPFKDIVWHADRLWCTSDYGLWTVNGNKVERVEDLPSEVSVCTGNLSVADGVMLMGGVHGAALHDGQKWQLIFNQYHMEQSLEQGT
jgi:hypothetical protein